MSRWISQEAERLAPYTPGEQPQDQQYVKLNTNESPFPPSPKVLKAINRAEILKLNLYSDPTCAALTEAIARRYELKAKNVLAGNGSDEVLAFAFRAFCGAGQPVAFADVTYGFYKSQAALFDLDVKIIPLREDFTLHVDDYMDFPGTIVIANPNAPTGIAVPRNDIQRLLEANPDRVVIVDEAYVDFGAESCVPMIYRYDNLLVTQTMSKSRSLAGGRVGYALGSPELIADLNRVKYRSRYRSVFRSTVYTLITVAAVSILVATLWLPVLQIYGSSMTPTLQDGEIIFSVKTSEFEPGEIVAFYYNNKILVKRVICGPGDWIDIDEDGTVYVNEVRLEEPYLTEKTLGDCNIDLPFQVPDGKVFVMGDHRSTSVDSRNTAVGCVAQEQIVGKIIFRIWPLNRIGTVD